MIYIQSDKERALPHHFDAACALYGAIDSGLDYRLTSTEEMQSGKFDLLFRKNPVIGSADFMSEVFLRLDKTPRLPKLSDRDAIQTTLEDARKRIEPGEAYFLKPCRHKLFSGCIFNQQTAGRLSQWEGSTEVLLYEPFNSNILSEWRLYIAGGKIVDSRNYSGDFTLNPDYTTAASKIALLNDFPCTYVADVGILADGTNVIVEFNDMWAIGNYGIENTLYLDLLTRRYLEIMNN
jgi:hypothetical protein